MISHNIIELENGKIHAVQSGNPNNPAILFLHGWPENWRSYEKIINLANKDYFTVAIDLPGIGDSLYPNAPFLKNEIAKVVNQIVDKLNLHNVTIVGHDIGGQVVFSYLQEYPDELKAAVIMDVVIPGLNPWDEVLKNPYIWHFAFHSIPNLPETLVSGNAKDYFEYFFNAIAADPQKISPEIKKDYIKAYSKADSLSTGFNWYRGFTEDANYNKNIVALHSKISTPLLYIRGQRSGGDMDKYVSGFMSSGVAHIQTQIIPDCGHFIAEEQPELLWKCLAEFVNNPAKS